MKKGNVITISDVAEALGVSKTTVSRAISGKGRIGEATRQKVLAYIEEHDYKPNVIARGLAQSKTFNLCVVMPEDYALVDLPFFQEVITGIQEIAGMNEYDILLCICQENDITGLERVVRNRKVDGIVLLRTFLKDPQIELLLEKKIPFVTTGSTAYRKVKQVDNDQQSACRELTSILLMRQMKHIALLGGSESFVVNQNRYKGYQQAYREAGREVEETLVYRNLESRAFMDRAVEEMVVYLDELQRPNGLFYHAPDVPYFWARGNGWMAVGMAELLLSTPEDNPNHARILEGYRLMMKSLKDYQDKSGMWNQLIDKADCWPETSGSAMFTYAMIMGVKMGWLEAEEYGPIARKAWIALVPYINKDGDVEEVCVGTGKKNDLQYYYDRPRIIGDYHGQAPMLWCTYALLCK